MRRVVVVGASLAGLRAIEALRGRGFDGELLLLGDEPHRPYDRPPLSKQLLRGQWDAERIVLRKEPWDELDVELRLGTSAVALEPREQVVRLADGGSERYDGLVIATGASPRRLPFGHELGGVHVLRTLDDAQAIARELGAGPRVCVIGAGFIGLEVAASCRALGLSVSAVESMPCPLANKLGTQMAELIVSLHREHGVDLRLGARVEALEGGERVEAVRLAGGERLVADLVVVGIGVTPNTGWLESSGIALEDGVLCDASLKTSLPSVVAAGDVARFDNPVFGERMRVEHWTNAVGQASVAVERLLAGRAASSRKFESVPYFWSDQYEHKIQFAGVARPDDAVVVLEQSDGKLCALYGRADRLVGVLAIGRPAQLIKFRRKIGEGATLGQALRG